MTCPPWPARDPIKPPEGIPANGTESPALGSNPAEWTLYEVPISALKLDAPQNVYEHKPGDGAIQIKPYGPCHCVICHSHNQGDKFWESYVGRKGERRVVWCKRPICSGCGSPWVSVPCEGGHE